MSDPPGNSPSEYHHLFSRKTYNIGNDEVISENLYIWEDDRIQRLENN